MLFRHTRARPGYLLFLLEQKDVRAKPGHDAEVFKMLKEILQRPHPSKRVSGLVVQACPL